MPEVELSGGTIEYEDTGGSGPVIVLVHGLIMDGSVWRKVVGELRSDYRCVLPTLPLGGHRRPMRADADLSMRGIAEILGEFIERLDLREMTLAMSDWGGPQLLIGGARRVGQRRPSHAHRARPPARRTVASGAPRGDSRLLHPDPRGPAREARQAHARAPGPMSVALGIDARARSSRKGGAVNLDRAQPGSRR